jgi:uncharacterized protein (UPF0335 family)
LKDINPDIASSIFVSKDRVRALETKIERLEKENLALTKLDAFLIAKLEEDNA